MKTFYRLILVSMLLLGCAPTASAPSTGKAVVVSAAWPAMGFGILLDEKLVVQSLDLPARNYDIKVGDKLIDLRPLSDIEGVSKDAVPFDDKEAIWRLKDMATADVNERSKAAPVFVIRLEREGSIKEIEITIGYAHTDPAAKATATPAWGPGFYYYTLL